MPRISRFIGPEHTIMTQIMIKIMNRRKTRDGKTFYAITSIDMV